LADVTHFVEWSALGSLARSRAAAVAIAQAKLCEPLLHAYVEIVSESPRVRPGALAGLPYAAKDIFATSGRKPTCGLPRPLDIGFSGNAWALHRLDDLGAVRIGFCTMTELAYEPSGYSRHRSFAYNPWNPDFISGGSSSGSAVAVASGSAVFALGSDTGGSVRIPAHACGVTAWKPTYGCISVEGAMPLAPTLDTIGVLARGASDLKLPAAVLTDLAPPTAPIACAAVLSDLLGFAESEVRRACEAGIEAIAATGVKVIRREAGSLVQEIDKAALILLQGEPARIYQHLLDDAALDPILRRRLMKGLEIAEADLTQSRAARVTLAQRFIDQFLTEADIVVLPVMPIRTPSRESCDPTTSTFDARILYRLSEWTRFVNLLGFPAVAMPAGFDDRGLPIALQFIGRPNSDSALIALAADAQKLSDWHGRIPTGIIG
jgi:aspartyl-tRNA(Asn)/glutamyl-tRNA(Gln) amidotransferase subunit A